MKLTMFALVLVAAVVALPLCAAAAATRQVAPRAGLQGFTAQTNFMSVAGYDRWQEFRKTGTWPAVRRYVCDGMAGHMECGKCPGSANCPPAFTTESKFMSCVGHERWKTHTESGQWLTRCGVMEKMGCCSCAK